MAKLHERLWVMTLTVASFSRQYSPYIPSIDQLDRAVLFPVETTKAFRTKTAAAIDKWPAGTTVVKEYDNVPQCGFRLTNEYTSDSVYVRDPRGFTVAVSIQHFSSLVMNATIRDGLIEEPCIWFRDGVQNILAPIGSELYNRYSTATHRAINMKTAGIPPGSVCRTKDMVKKGQETFDNGYSIIYCGQYSISATLTPLKWTPNPDTPGNPTGQFSVNGKAPVHVFLVVDMDRFNPFASAKDQRSTAYVDYNLNIIDVPRTVQLPLNDNELSDLAALSGKPTGARYGFDALHVRHAHLNNIDLQRIY